MNRSMNMMRDIALDGALYEEGPSPDATEVRSDMLQELSDLRAKMSPNGLKEFEQFVTWSNNQRYAFPGTVDDQLGNMHPWQLQQVVQRFRTMAPAVDATPGEG